MKTAEWKRLVRPLLPTPDDFAFRRTLCYRTSYTWILSGAMAEGSALDKGVYVWKVAMPLFVPVEHVTLAGSARVAKHRILPGPELEHAIRSALDPVEENAALASLASSSHLEVAAYAAILRGNSDAVPTALAMAKDFEATLDWQRRIVDRIESIEARYGTAGLEGAKAQLETWRAETIAHLELRHPE